MSFYFRLGQFSDIPDRAIRDAGRCILIRHHQSHPWTFTPSWWKDMDRSLGALVLTNISYFSCKENCQHIIRTYWIVDDIICSISTKLFWNTIGMEEWWLDNVQRDLKDQFLICFYSKSTIPRFPCDILL